MDMQQLCDAVMPTWIKISEERFQHFIESMPRRIKAGMKANMWSNLVLVRQQAKVWYDLYTKKKQFVLKILKLFELFISVDANTLYRCVSGMKTNTISQCNWGQFCKTIVIFVHIYQVLEKKNT